jgi:ribosomal protein L4
MSRPVVSVFDIEAVDAVVGTVTLPAVFTAPIRADVVHQVHVLMAKNKRQAYAVTLRAGMQVRTISAPPMHCLIALFWTLTHPRLLLHSLFTDPR